MFFFCVKQETSYEVRISEWRSEVCSSDLSFWKLSTKALLAALSRSFDHCEVFFTPSAASPTAPRMPWSKEKARPNSGTSSPNWAYFFTKTQPIQTSRETKSEAEPTRLLVGISQLWYAGSPRCENSHT